MTIIYKQYIDFNTIEDFFLAVNDRITVTEDKIELLIRMKRINNLYKSIKLRICELIRNKVLKTDCFFEEDRTFVLNMINREYPHFVFTNKGIEALLQIPDDEIKQLVTHYNELLFYIYDDYAELLN